jgi:hypothetical protein
VPADPRYRREDFGTWIQQQATPAAVAFRERQPPGPGATADLPALADEAASRVQAALAALDEIKDYAAEHAPGLLAGNRPPVPASLRDALFLEGFTISGTGTEIAFDFGDLDLIVVQADPGGHCHSVVLCP